MTDAASLGASLALVVSSFEERVSEVRASLAFRGLGEESISALEKAELAISALEGDMATARGAIVREAALLRSRTGGAWGEWDAALIVD